MNTGAEISAVSKLGSLTAEIQTKDTLWVSLWHWLLRSRKKQWSGAMFLLVVKGIADPFALIPSISENNDLLSKN